MESIPMLDLKAQYNTIKDEIKVAIDEVLESQHFILGPKVSELEEKIASYSGVKYALGVSSGSDALLLSLMALGIGEGDIVITTAFSFFATAGCIARLGAIPIFVDIDLKDYNISADEIESTLENMEASELTKVKAIIPVHLYGQMADMGRIMEIAQKYNVKVVEDAAQAIGAVQNYEGINRKAGSIGDTGCFSFFPSKNLGGYGDGGMVVTNDEELYNKMKILRAHGSSPKYYHKYIGGNFRLDAIQAAVLLVKFKYLDEWTIKRNGVAERYNKLLSSFGEIIIPIKDYELEMSHIYHQYVIRISKRDIIIDELKNNNVSTAVYYPVPLHIQECFEYLGYSIGMLPNTEYAANTVMALPIYPEISNEDQIRIADTIEKALLR